MSDNATPNTPHESDPGPPTADTAQPATPLNQPVPEPAAPQPPPAAPAPPLPAAATTSSEGTARSPRMWPASTVIAAGVATVLLSGLVGGFIGAALDGSRHDGVRPDRFAAVDRDGGRMGRFPGGVMGGPGGADNGPGQQWAPVNPPGGTQG